MDNITEWKKIKDYEKKSEQNKNMTGQKKSNYEKRMENRNEYFNEKESIDLLFGVSRLILVLSLIFGIGSIVYGLSSSPLFIIIGLLTIFEGVIVFALFEVLCSISSNLIEIRKNTEKKG